MSTAFEQYLDGELGAPADRLNKRAKRAATVAKRLAAASAAGDMRAVESGIRELQALPLAELLAETEEGLARFDFRAYLQAGFAADFEAACSEAELPLEGQFPNYTVFPFPVRFDLEGPTVLINRKRVGLLRPPPLIAAIREERDRLERSPFNPNEFIGVLFTSWERLNALQTAGQQLQIAAPQPLKSVYRDLAPFARWRRDYPESFFAFDVQRLLLSGVIQYGDFQCQLEKGRKGADAIRTVDRDGQVRLITTVDFVRVAG